MHFLQSIYLENKSHEFTESGQQIPLRSQSANQIHAFNTRKLQADKRQINVSYKSKQFFRIPLVTGIMIYDK